MKLEDQVTSLELSKRLKELGAKQDSAWYWYYLEAEGIHVGEIVHSTPQLVDRKYRDEAVKGKYEWDYAFISAFTVAELGVLLPQSLEIDNTIWNLTCEHWQDEWGIRYGQLAVSGEPNGTEANVRAKMLIYLLENKLIVLL